MFKLHRPLVAMAALSTACVDMATTDDSGLPGYPNLVVVGFYYENLGEEYSFTVLVENQGDAGADTFSVDLYLDRSTEPRLQDQGDESLVVLEGLESGGVTEAVFTVSAAQVCAGCSTWVFVDSNDQVAEAYEDDNAWGPMEILSR